MLIEFSPFSKFCCPTILLKGVGCYFCKLIFVINCVVLSMVCVFQFKVNGEWWTWIDYNKFHELVQRYYLTDGASTFTAEVNRFCRCM